MRDDDENEKWEGGDVKQWLVDGGEGSWTMEEVDGNDHEYETGKSPPVFTKPRTA